MKSFIEKGNAVLGVELGSTRIKAVLIDDSFNVLAQGDFTWENKLVDNIWSYSYDEIIAGLQQAYSKLCDDVRVKYNAVIATLKAIGISGMMHGYLPLDSDNKPLCSFRTWRNTFTSASADSLTELFDFHIPERWSIAHLYHAIVNKEEHVNSIAKITTLAGYVNMLLGGVHGVGICEGSGMFPVENDDYDNAMLDKFRALVKDNCYSWDIKDILPKIILAKDSAGRLSEEGARLLDISGNLQSGAVLCAPEGDAATGMVATNSVLARTGNVSTGTSAFSMIVLEKPLTRMIKEVDVIASPSGSPTAMIHCNNCTNEINAWVSLFAEVLTAYGQKVDMNAFYEMLFNVSQEGEKDGGGLTCVNFLSAEPVVKVDNSNLTFSRTVDAKLSLANFMKTQLYSAIAPLKYGMDILLQEEHIQIDNLFAHGGFVKTKNIGQNVIAAALDTPISVMETAGEGGAWGIAVLASYTVDNTLPLGEYLNEKVFADCRYTTVTASAEDVDGFKKYMEGYISCLNS